MPIDQNGNRVDIIVDPKSPMARMNIGQYYEHGINFISEFVRKRMAEEYKVNPLKAYATLLEWLSDVSPTFAELTASYHKTDKDRAAYAKLQIDTRIEINILPFQENITLENMLIWRDKWNALPTCVTWKVKDRNGKWITKRSKVPVVVGATYFMCLCKYPHGTAPGPAFISHTGIPTKPGRDMRNMSPLNLKPVKLPGEDENRMLLMEADENEVVRLSNLYANSPQGAELMFSTILSSDTPMNISRVNISNGKLLKKNAVLALLHHEASFLGINIKDTLTTDPFPNVKASHDDGLDVNEFSTAVYDTLVVERDEEEPLDDSGEDELETPDTDDDDDDLL